MVPRALPVWVRAQGVRATRRAVGVRTFSGGTEFGVWGLKGSLGQTPEKQKSEKLPSTYWPPKSCIPKRAKTTINRKRRNNRLMMDFMELRRETTRFLRDAQYLPTEAGGGGGR